MAHETVPYFYSVLGDWGELEYVGPAKDWDEEILRGSFDGREVHELVPEGRPREGGADVRRPDDLEHAQRLIAAGEDAERAQKRSWRTRTAT